MYEKSEPYGRFRQWTVSGFIIVGLVLTVAMVANADLERDTGSSDRLSLLSVKTAQLAPESGYTISRRFAGQVEAAQVSAVGFELAGMVNTLTFDEGDVIKKGELIATLDLDRLKARRQEQVAQLQDSEARVKLSKSTLDRLNKALNYDGVTPQQVDEARQQLESARASLNVIRASINTFDIEIGKSSLYAPFAATVIERHIDPGTVIASGAPVFTLQKKFSPEARIGIAGEIPQQLTVGNQIQIEIEGLVTEATVRSLLPNRNPVTRVIDVILEIDDESARPGDLVELVLRRDIEQPGYWIPLSALEEGERGLWTLFIAEPVLASDTYQLRRHFIEIVHLESNRAFISEFNHDNREYVLEGLQRIVAGQYVRVDHEQKRYLAEVGR